jgi:intracellular multiplication protein IcmP
VTPEQRPRGPGAALGLAMLLGAFVFAAFTLWSLARPAIVAVVFAVSDAMLAATGLFSDHLEPLRAQIAGTDPADPAVTPLRLWRLLWLAGGPWAWLGAVLLAGSAVACFRKAEARAFRRDMDLDALFEEQARTFPTGAPFAARRLGLVEPKRQSPARPLDPSLHLSEWIALFAHDADDRVSEAVAAASLAAQLGPLWGGARSAPPVHRVLFAAFALHAAREQEHALGLLGDGARSLPRPPAGEGRAGPEGPLPLSAHAVTKADEILLDPDVRLPCEAVARAHAYAVPALMSVLCHARLRGGVLNPGLFAWVRLVDRPLFMALDTLGAPIPGVPWQRGPAPAPLAEGMGARDHWARELEAGGALVLPAVDAALAAVRAAVMHDARVPGKEDG